VTAQPDLPFTDEDVRRAAAGVCAQSLHRLDHPSGTGEFLQDRAIASSHAAGRPTDWSVLQTEDFAAVTDQMHRLIIDAADHTYLAASGPRPSNPAVFPMSLDHLLPPHVELWATGADVRHAAICLAHDLIEEELRRGPVFSGVLDEPIASRFNLDGPAPTWGRLPARRLIPALHLIHQAVVQAQHRIDAAVDASIRAATPRSLPATATVTAANARSPAAHRTAASGTPPAGPPPPSPTPPSASPPRNR
jgi:hypothetical protein